MRTRASVPCGKLYHLRLECLFKCAAMHEVLASAAIFLCIAGRGKSLRLSLGFDTMP